MTSWKPNVDVLYWAKYFRNKAHGVLVKTFGFVKELELYFVKVL